MPIGIVQLNGRARPAFICDECGREIVDAGTGNYLWSGKDKLVTEVIYLHKSCTPSYEAKFREVEGIMDLNYLLVHLLKASGIKNRKKIKEAVERAGFIDSID